MITTVYASESAFSSLISEFAKCRQSQAPMDHGIVTGICYCYEDIPCHHFIWLQSPGRNLRALYGNRRIVREDGWYPGASSS